MRGVNVVKDEYSYSIFAQDADGVLYECYYVPETMRVKAVLHVKKLLNADLSLV